MTSIRFWQIVCLIISSSQNTCDCSNPRIFLQVKQFNHQFSMSNGWIKFAKDVTCCYCVSFFQQNGLLFALIQWQCIFPAAIFCVDVFFHEISMSTFRTHTHTSYIHIIYTPCRTYISSSSIHWIVNYCSSQRFFLVMNVASDLRCVKPQLITKMARSEKPTFVRDIGVVFVCVVL